MKGGTKVCGGGGGRLEDRTYHKEKKEPLPKYPNDRQVIRTADPSLIAPVTSHIPSQK